MPFPLSACLMIMCLLFLSLLRALRSSVVRLLCLLGLSCMFDSSSFVFEMYSSIEGCDVGGSQADFCLNGEWGEREG